MTDQEIKPERRLAAIMATDVVGYSRAMQSDEAGTLAALAPSEKPQRTKSNSTGDGSPIRLVIASWRSSGVPWKR